MTADYSFEEYDQVLIKGKHKGKTYLDVYTTFPSYCKWVLEQGCEDFDLNFYMFLNEPERREKIRTTMQFGKYKGLGYQEILNNDEKYCIYALNNYHRNKFVKDFALWIIETKPKQLETEIKNSNKKRDKRFRDYADEMDRQDALCKFKFDF